MDLMDYRRKIIANSPHLMSASGAVASFSDGADDLPLKSLVVNINPVQDLHGQKSPYPAGGGKNLFDESTIYHGYYAPDIIDRMTPDKAYRTCVLTLPAGTYTFSCDMANIYILRYAIGEQNTPVTNKQSTVTFIVPSEDVVKISFRNTGTTAITGTFHTQIESGSTATSYAPYSNICPISGWNAVNVKNGNTVIATISLGQTVYGGTLNPLTGVLTVDRAIVDLGTLDWRMSGSGNTAFHYANTSALGVATNISTTLNYICSNYSIVAVSSSGTATGMAFTSANQLRIRDATYASASDFKTAMDGVTLCYEVANPTEIQLTPHQIRTLYGNNTIFADTGNIALEYWAHP